MKSSPEKWTRYEKQVGIQFFDTFTSKGKKNRKWRFRFRFRGKLYSEVLGWESRGMSEAHVVKIWNHYAANRTLGKEPFTPGGEIALQKAAKQEAARQEAAERAHTVRSIFIEAMLLRDVSATPKHAASYRRHFRDWIDPVLGGLPIRDIKASHVAQVLKNLQDGVPPSRQLAEGENAPRKGARSPQTQAHVWNVMRMIWVHASDNSLVAGRFPGAKIKPKVNNERMRYLSEKEAGAVLADLRGTAQNTVGRRRSKKGSLDAWGKALLSLHCGLRAGEILNLTWRNIDLNAKIGIVYDTKNKGTSRKFYLTPAIIDMLQERISFSAYIKPGDFIFTNREGGKSFEIGEIFQGCFIRLGINKGDENNQDRVVFHTFRHTFATWLAQRGTTMSVIAELMGHSITKTTERYIQYAPKTIIKDALSFFAGMHVNTEGRMSSE